MANYSCRNKTKKSFLQILVFIFLLVGWQIDCCAAENIFYALRDKTPDRMTPFKNTLSSLEKNYKKISILIPQAYRIDETGEVNGEIEPAILEFATRHSMKIMPLVTNAKFSKETAKQFLSDVNAQSKALKSIVSLCQKNHFYGIQMDFEMVRLEDRAALTKFYEYTANELHKNGYVISFALAPIVSDKKGESDFLDKIYENWEGAYDLKSIGAVADFVSIMAYNQHGGITTPGPTASWEWVNQVVKYALQFIPPEKISIGLPDFSTYWRTGKDADDTSGKIHVIMSGISFEKAMDMIHQHKASLQWDKNDKVYFSLFSNHWLNEYIFLEDFKSFHAKYDLVKKFKLRGVSVFDLGTEDPRIWKMLMDHA